MVIRDPLYDYLYLTKVEQSIVDHPLFQRLRHISQNGTAYYTYPSNRSCRFMHSLGTMEIAGQVIAHVFQDLNNEVVKKFLNETFDLMIIAQQTLLITLDNIKRDALIDRRVFAHYGIDCTLLELHHQLPENSSLQQLSELHLARLVLFEASRLAALLHDLGHFPFSHTLENAFSYSEKIAIINDRFLKNLSEAENAPELHEKIGVCLLNIVFPDNANNAFNRCCRFIARNILMSKNSPETKEEKIYSTLHSIIAGNLDVDRLDYSKRDPKLSGMELGAFDLERLTHNMQLVDKENNGNYLILPNIKALSSVESFYHQRYLMYKYLIYHHNKLRMDKLVCEITYGLAICWCEKNPIEIYNFLKERHFDYLWENCANQKYFLCTEAWLLALIADAEEIIKRYIENQKKDDNIELINSLQSLLLLIDTFLRRKTENLYSLFKHCDKYNEFISNISEKLGISETEVVAKITSLKFTNNSFKEIEKNYGVSIFFVPTKPKTIFNSESNVDLDIALDEKTTENIITYSPYLKSLVECVKNDQQFQMFLVKKEIKSKPDLIKQICDEVCNYICQQIKQQEKS
ncbi:MAG: HD domain-containing protein [Clostridiales bacterium]|jgi:HD superfamily phosphohydrolase|nr:HD domain-containing protein [Clostridiales bacterium]